MILQLWLEYRQIVGLSSYKIDIRPCVSYTKSTTQHQIVSVDTDYIAA